jgi:hypothetical protein
MPIYEVDIRGKVYEVEARSEQAAAAAIQQMVDGQSNNPLRYVDNIARRIASGASFGYADEFAAKMNEATGRGDYTSNVAQERARDSDFRQSNPVASTVAEIGGAIASPVTKLAGAKIASMSLPRYAKYALEGAGLGALAGSGESSEGNRGTGALVGGTLGGAFGAAIPAGAELLGRGARNVLQRIMSGETSPAARELSKAFGRDNITIPGAISKFDELGPESVMADLGPNVRGLADLAATMPGKALAMADDVLGARAFSQGDRIMEGALKATGVESLDDLIRARSTAARPLYEKAFADRKGITSPVIDRLLNNPIVKKAISNGVKIVSNEADAANIPVSLDDYAITAFNEAGDPVISGVPTLRLLDAAKRGLDDIIDGYKDKTTGRLELDNYGRSIDSIRKTLVRELDDLTKGTDGVSVYKQAREAWAGPSPLIEAHNHIKKIVEGARDGADVTGRLYGSKTTREKLNFLLRDPEAIDQFTRTIAKEKIFAATNRGVGGNSRTAARLAAQADMQNNGLQQSALNIMERPGIGTIIGEGFNAVRNSLRAPPTAVADKLAPMLFSTDPRLKAEALEELTKRVNAGTILNRYATAARMGLLGSARAGGYSGGLLGGSNQ